MAATLAVAALLFLNDALAQVRPNRLLVCAVESVESLEESLFIGETEAVIDIDLRLNMMRRLAVATIQEAVCRSNTGGVGRL